MQTIFGYCVFLIVAYFALQLFVILYQIVNYRRKNVRKPIEGNFPKVSILIPVRNEETNIVKCLQSIAQLSYPKDKLQVLIGNDGSTDGTVKLVDTFIADKSQFKFFNISVNLGKAKGKANALAHLAQLSEGDFLFFTDADTTVNVDWVEQMLAHFEAKTGVVCGTTLVEGTNLLGHMQSLDWLFFTGVINAFANAGVASTGVGNNMAVRREAYLSVGGFENLDFSITEDFKLYNAIIKENWGWKNILNRQTLNASKAAPDFRTLLNQRKRWLTGAMDLPLQWKVVFVMFGFFAPSLLVVFFFGWQLGLYIWLIKFMLEAVYMTILSARLNKAQLLNYLLAYQFYGLFMPGITVIKFFNGKPNVWKDRTYA